MSIKKLIKKHCPDGFEYKTLGEIATEISGASDIKKDLLGTGNHPCVIYGQIYTTYEIWFDKCVSVVDEDLIKNKKYCNKGDLIITGAGETPEDIGKACAYLGEEECLIGGAAKVIKHNQNPKYLAYVLSTNELSKQKIRHSKIGSITNLTTDGLKKIKIPLPPLEIQAKIADILDRFRELGKFLKKELEIRKKQYEFYRDKLIVGGGVDGSDDYCEWKTLGEIANKTYGGAELTNPQLGTGDYPCISYVDIYTKYEIWFDECISKVDENLIKNKKYCYPNDLLIASASNSSQNIGRACVYLGKEKIIVGDKVIVIKHNQNAKYLSYSLSTSDANFQKHKFSKIGSVTNMNTNDVKKLQIPLPPLEIQKKIAEKLDIFRSLCNDITVGIPKEIELNQKRYEYYRDLLIS